MILVIGENSVWQRTLLFENVVKGEVNRARKVKSFPSGKGLNVVRAISSLGSNAHLIGYAGGTIGMMFARHVEKEKLPASLVEIKNETRICSTIIEDNGTVTELVEPAPAITHEESRAFKKLLEQGIEKAKTLVISGTAVKGEDPLIYSFAINLAKGKGIPSIMDSYTSESKKALFASPEVLKINMDEFKDLLQIKDDISHPKDRIYHYEKLMDMYGIKWIIITKGEDGAEAFNGREFLSVKTPEIKVVNTIGSGDAFSAGIAMHIAENGLENNRIGKALKKAAAMATANCLNIIPGKVEKSDYDFVFERIRIERYM